MPLKESLQSKQVCSCKGFVSFGFGNILCDVLTKHMNFSLVPRHAGKSALAGADKTCLANLSDFGVLSFPVVPQVLSFDHLEAILVWCRLIVVQFGLH